MINLRSLNKSIASVLVAFSWTGAALAQGAICEIVPAIEKKVLSEMKEWGITGVSVAVVQDQRLVYSKGFGETRADSVYRAGSISKLFNAVAVMQQVEKGALDLDAPIDPALLPLNPFPGKPAVTLRQILCHRGGLQREAAVGGYLDPSEPGIRSTVESLRLGTLVTPPGEMMRYSNIAPTLAGFLVEQASAKDYEAYQMENVLGPLGMSDSCWTRANVNPDKMAPSNIRVADGQGGFTWQRTPLFDLGTIPAGNLFTTVEDLAKFSMALMRRDGRILKTSTLESMWAPQLTDNKTGFGIGFVVGEFQGHKTIGHSGAVFGHSSSFTTLPDDGIAVIVIGNEDIANGRIGSISSAILTLVLNGVDKEEEASQKAPMHHPNPSELVGDFLSESYWAEVRFEDGALKANVSGQPSKLHWIKDDQFRLESRIYSGAGMSFTRNEQGEVISFKLAGQTFERAPKNPAPIPEVWKSYCGTYGHDIIPLVVSERFGALFIMTENMVDYRIQPINARTAQLPPGMYIEEEVVFLTDLEGLVFGMDFANMVFKKK
jgi:CubicO group peptidase (beta-lactamase class C family)